MAASGPLPKPPEQRRNANPKLQSEWIVLPARLEKPILPPYRRSFTMPAYLYRAWRNDPITSQYTEVDVARAVELATEYAELDFATRDRHCSKFGMDPMSRRSLRWRTPLEERQQVEAVTKAKEVRRMRLMSEAA